MNRNRYPKPNYGRLRRNALQTKFVPQDGNECICACCNHHANAHHWTEACPTNTGYASVVDSTIRARGK